MNIRVNKKDIEISEHITLSLGDLLDMQKYNGSCFAVMVNNFFIPKDTYSTTTICDLDHIEIITPIQGG